VNSTDTYICKQGIPPATTLSAAYRNTLFAFLF
jgi:hypothetical protein